MLMLCTITGIPNEPVLCSSQRACGLCMPRHSLLVRQPSKQKIERPLPPQHLYINQSVSADCQGFAWPFSNRCQTDHFDLGRPLVWACLAMLDWSYWSQVQFNTIFSFKKKICWLRHYWVAISFDWTALAFFVLKAGILCAQGWHSLCSRLYYM